TDVTARRELEEEVGMRAGRIERLCEFWNSAGHDDEVTHVYMALDLEPCALAPQGPEEAHMTIEPVSLDDVPDLISTGRLTEAKTGENRVAITPDGVRELVAAGHRVLIEHGAGDGSSLADGDFRAAGAEVVSVDDAWAAGMVVKVKEPQEAEYARLRDDLVLF